ncbi:MAG: hypothetical protein RLZZ477_188, partial [Actinomycetota bacterium]
QIARLAQDEGASLLLLLGDPNGDLGRRKLLPYPRRPLLE